MSFIEQIRELIWRDDVFSCYRPYIRSWLRKKEGRWPRWKTLVEALECADDLYALSPHLIRFPSEASIGDSNEAAHWGVAFWRHLQYGDPPPKAFPPSLEDLEDLKDAPARLCEVLQVPQSRLRLNSQRRANPLASTVAKWAERLGLSPLRFAQPFTKEDLLIEPWSDFNAVVLWSDEDTRPLRDWVLTAIKAEDAEEPKDLERKARLLYFFHGFNPPKNIPGESPQDFAEALRLSLMRRGMSLGELQRETGMAHGTVYNWLGGKNAPRPSMERLLEVALKLPGRILSTRPEAVGRWEELNYLYLTLPPVLRRMVDAYPVEEGVIR